MQQDTPNSLSREILPGYSLFHQNLARYSDRNCLRSYSLDEFGWELGVYALRKKDADVVMGFLGDLARAVETERLDVKFDAEKKVPVVWMTSGRFPKIGVHVSLGLEESYVWQAVASSGAESDKLWVVPDHYKDHDEYFAWKKALVTLSQKGKDKLERIDGPPETAPYLGMNLSDGTGVSFFARANMRQSRGWGSEFFVSLDVVLNRTLVAFELVHGAYAVTDKLPKLIEQRNEELTQQMLSGI